MNRILKAQLNWKDLICLHSLNTTLHTVNNKWKKNGKYLLIYIKIQTNQTGATFWTAFFFLKNKFRLLQPKQLNKWHTMSMQFYCCHQEKQKAQRVGKHIYCNEFAVEEWKVLVIRTHCNRIGKISNWFNEQTRVAFNS